MQNLAEKHALDRQHTLQVRALEHYSMAAPFHHREYLGLLRHCLGSGFLHSEEQRFLGHLLDEYSLRYLEWCWRIPWLKAQIAEAQAKEPKPLPQYIQPMFGWCGDTNWCTPIQAPKPQRIGMQIGA